jgi:hypothetical protein
VVAVGADVFYDLHVPGWENYLAEGFINHNSGKTMSLWAKVLKLSAINQGLPGIWVVPQYDHIIHTILPKLEELDPATGEPWFLRPGEYEYRKQDHEIHWPGGGPIWFKSGEHASAIAGPNVAWAAVDEPSSIPQDAWRNTCARVRHTSAKLRQTVAAGTLEQLGWLDEYFFDPERPARYKRYVMSTAQNTELLKYDPTYLDRIQENATEAEKKAFVEGRGVMLDGQPAYHVFDADRQWREDVPEFDQAQPLVLCCDFNVSPMCWVIGQRRIGPAGPEAHVLEGCTLEVATTDTACDAVLAKFPSAPAGWLVYGDCNGRNRSVQSHRSNYDIIAQRLSLSGPVKLKVPSSNPPIAERLSAVNRLCLSASGHTRLWVRKWLPYRECPTRGLVRSLQRSKVRAGREDLEKKPGETVTHAADALGYWIAAEWPVTKPTIRAGMTRVERFL